jgi:hypothetical protein
MIRRAPLALAVPLVALTIALAGCSSGGGGTGAGTADATAAAAAAAPGGTATVAGSPASGPPMSGPTTTGPLPVDARPTTARGAVEAFLVAAVRGDADASYALLSPPQQQAYSANEWLHAQADLPRYLGFTVHSEQPLADASGTEVTVTAVLQSQLDEIVGLVPARATSTLTAVPVDAEWRVDLSRTRTTPLLPPDADAPSAVRTWVAERQECRAPAEYRSLVGAPALADALCGAQGDVRTAEARPLSELGDAAPVLNAFGADAATWARVVDVEAPSRLAVVVAPVDDRWLVVGVTSHS